MICVNNEHNLTFACNIYIYIIYIIAMVIYGY